MKPPGKPKRLSESARSEPGAGRDVNPLPAPGGCGICRRLGRVIESRSYIHCPVYGLVHMDHCTKDSCKYHRYDISADWCSYPHGGRRRYIGPADQGRG